MTSPVAEPVAGVAGVVGFAPGRVAASSGPLGARGGVPIGLPLFGGFGRSNGSRKGWSASVGGAAAQVHDIVSIAKNINSVVFFKIAFSCVLVVIGRTAAGCYAIYRIGPTHSEDKGPGSFYCDDDEVETALYIFLSSASLASFAPTLLLCHAAQALARSRI